MKKKTFQGRKINEFSTAERVSSTCLHRDEEKAEEGMSERDTRIILLLS